MSDEQEKASLWLPEPDVLIHQVIGKLGEEASELASICCRILIQGINETNPDDGKPNIEALIEEISDVRALLWTMENTLSIGEDRDRMIRKHRLKIDWFRQLVPPK